MAMMKNSLLLLLLLLTGCATRTWTETTETVRPAGTPTERTEDRVLADEYFELRTGAEGDGYEYVETLSTDDEGRMRLSLLPPALQAISYNQDVELTLFSFSEDAIVWTRTVTLAQAREAVREWSVQAKLGQQIRLRRKQADLLDRAIEATTEPELRDQLESIRLRIVLRPDWE
jgi:hypothetical protein